MNINQEEAAERCGLHRTYYSGVERGVRNISLVNIERISEDCESHWHNYSYASSDLLTKGLSCRRPQTPEFIVSTHGLSSDPKPGVFGRLAKHDAVFETAAETQGSPKKLLM